MAKITVIGGTGYAGSNIVAAAARHGHEVAALSRTAPTDPVSGVVYVQGSVLDHGVLALAFEGTDVVISALAPRGEIAGRMLEIVEKLEGLSASTGIRLGVIGGAGSLLVAPGGPKLIDTDGFPEEFRAEAVEMEDVLTQLQNAASSSDWFYVSPPAGFGSYAVGELTGTWRVGGDILLVDDNGQTTISGADFGEVVVAEIETPVHSRQRFTVAY
jgi:putative NADH-flavin reductase